MPIVAMINWKGGVGKTTLSLALADFLSAIHARNILVIDVDPQANASLSLLGNDAWEWAEEHKQTVAEVFAWARNSRATGPPVRAIQLIRPISRTIGALGQLSVVASSPRLQEIEEKASQSDQAWRYSSGSPYAVLQQSFLDIVREYDDVIIDCPPSTGMITLNALTLCSGYLLPAIPDHISTIGIPHIRQRIDEHSASLGKPITCYGTVINRFRRNNFVHQAKLEDLRNARYCEPVWHTIVPEVKYDNDTMSSDVGTMTLKARYGGGQNALYQAFESLAAEFLGRIG